MTTPQGMCVWSCADIGAMQAKREWPAPSPGTYALLFVITAPLTICAGSLGRIDLCPGHYLYFGSALGPGGLRARLARHFAKEKRVRWHVDYLAAAAPVTGVAWLRGSDRRECMWARRAAETYGASIPARGFGSSDCRQGCAAHLVRMPAGFALTEWVMRL